MPPDRRDGQQVEVALENLSGSLTSGDALPKSRSSWLVLCPAGAQLPGSSRRDSSFRLEAGEC